MQAKPPSTEPGREDTLQVQPPLHSTHGKQTAKANITYIIIGWVLQGGVILSAAIIVIGLFLVSLQPGLSGFIVPSKVYSILAAGRPYVAAMEEGSEADGGADRVRDGLARAQLRGHAVQSDRDAARERAGGGGVVTLRNVGGRLRRATSLGIY